MGNPRFKFTLSHSVAGTKVISEPDGWKSCVLKLERHPEFHSLIEYFEGGAMGGFIFYGSDGVRDGGRDYVMNIDKTYGFNANVSFGVEISFDDGLAWIPVFAGVLKMGALKELPDNKVMVPVIPDTVWSKFINRMNTPVSLGSSTDLDGNACAAASSITVNLPGQVLRTKFKRNTTFNDDNLGLFPVGFGSGVTTYLMFDNSYNDLDEIDERFEYGSQVSGEDPTTVSKYLFKTKYAGSYRIQASIRYSLIFSSSVNVTSAQFKLSYKNPSQSTYTTVNIGSATGAVGVTTHTGGAPKTIDTTLTLEAGAEVYVYGVLVLSASRDITYLPDFDSDSGAGFSPVYTDLEITADTEFPDSTAEGYTLHEAMKNVLIKYGLGSNPFISNYLSTATGCAGKFVLVKGLQLRGYTLTEKPFFTSFKELWDGANPIFNLGLGVERSGSVDVIRVEEKAHFYDKSSASTNFNYITTPREYDEQLAFKKISVGYTKWKSEDLSSLDDPQAKQTYASELITFGSEGTFYSSFIAASLAIEIARRVERKKKQQDYKFDDDTFIIATENTSSPFDPETNGNYSGTSNLLNEATRYNKILSPKRNLYRWANYFLGGFQKMLSGRLRFVSGEGNYDMFTALNNGVNICLGITESATENADFYLDGFTASPGATDPGNPYLFLPDLYDFNTQLSWEDYLSIRTNKKKAIGISQRNSNYKKVFIKELSFTLCEAKVAINAWAAEPFDLVVPESTQPTTPTC